MLRVMRGVMQVVGVRLEQPHQPAVAEGGVVLAVQTVKSQPMPLVTARRN